MKNNRIIRAYDRSAPSRETEDRIWQRISMKADMEANMDRAVDIKHIHKSAAPVSLVAKAERPFLQRVGLIAACAVLTVSALAGGYFSVRKLFPSEPQEFLPAASGVEPSSSTEQGSTGCTENAVSITEVLESSDSGDAETLSGETFRLHAAEILAQAGISDLRPEDATVEEQAPSYEWERVQVAVTWSDRETPITVLFDEQDSVFLRIYGFDWIISDDSPCASQEDADALALRLFHALPVDQDYVMRGCEKYDEEYWTYDFCREVEPGLYSSFECVRLSVNPTRGEAQFIKAFYVPLLDDHAPDAIPLTEEEALQAVEIDLNSAQNLKNAGRLTIKKSVTIPRRMIPDDRIEPANCADTSSLCWLIRYYEAESDDYIAGGWVKYVDYYSGEIINYDYIG